MHQRSLRVSYLTFVSLGLNDGLLGVAWPSIRDTFDVSLASVGFILGAVTLGHIIASTNSGRLAARMGVGSHLLLSTLVRASGILAIALAPTWGGIIVAALLIGLGGGGLDAGLNSHVATHHRASHMNWLHASFGIGTTLGPLLVTGTLLAGLAWRWSYATVGMLYLALAATFLLTMADWQERSGGAQAPAQPPPARNLDTLKLPVVWLTAAVTFFITGIEMAAGQWTYPLFTEARALLPSTAGLWVSLYWGSFTLGRLLVGFVADRVRPMRLLRATMVGNLLGAGLLWWNPANAVSFAGLALMGLALAPMYPSLTSMTPRRVGQRHAANTIGFQVSGSGLGAMALPWLAGILASRADLEIVGPFLLATSVMLLLFHEGVALTSSKT